MGFFSAAKVTNQQKGLSHTKAFSLERVLRAWEVFTRRRTQAWVPGYGGCLKEKGTLSLKFTEQNCVLKYYLLINRAGSQELGEQL